MRYYYYYYCEIVTQSRPPLCDPMDCSLARLLCLWNSPGKSIGVGCHFLLQEIILTQGIKHGSPALLADSLPSEPPGQPTLKRHFLMGIKFYQMIFSSVQFSCSVMSDSLRPYELQHARPPCPSPTPGVHPNPLFLFSPV